MIRFAPMSSPEPSVTKTIASRGPKATSITVPELIAAELPSSEVRGSAAVVAEALPVIAPEKPVAEPLTLTGEPAPRVKKASPARKSKVGGSKSAKEEGNVASVGSESLVLDLGA